MRGISGRVEYKKAKMDEREKREKEREWDIREKREEKEGWSNIFCLLFLIILLTFSNSIFFSSWKQWRIE